MFFLYDYQLSFKVVIFNFGLNLEMAGFFGKYGEQDSSGTTLMDLITADPSTAPPAASSSSSSSSTASASASSATQPPAYTSGLPPVMPTALGKPAAEKKSKRASLMQIQNDTISAAKAALHPVRTNILPQKHKKKKVARLLSTMIAPSAVILLVF